MKTELQPPTESDEAILEQMEQIKNEIAETKPLVGRMVAISVLSTEYDVNDVIYQEKIQNLSTKYQKIRQIRPDGNCFFRAVLFAYLERLIHDPSDYARFQSVAKHSKDSLVAFGFPALTIEDFHELFMEVIEGVEKATDVTDLESKFCDITTSDYMVVYLRLLTSGKLQEKTEFFMNFIDGGLSVKEFCNQEVEPMGKESDHIHIIALTEALGIHVQVEYMDRGESGTVNHHDFPDDGAQPHVFLLYRPGHYDILYK